MGNWDEIEKELAENGLGFEDVELAPAEDGLYLTYLDKTEHLTKDEVLAWATAIRELYPRIEETNDPLLIDLEEDCETFIGEMIEVVTTRKTN